MKKKSKIKEKLSEEEPKLAFTNAEIVRLIKNLPEGRIIKKG